MSCFVNEKCGFVNSTVLSTPFGLQGLNEKFTLLLCRDRTFRPPPLAAMGYASGTPSMTVCSVPSL